MKIACNKLNDNQPLVIAKYMHEKKEACAYMQAFTVIRIVNVYEIMVLRISKR